MNDNGKKVDWSTSMSQLTEMTCHNCFAGTEWETLCMSLHPAEVRILVKSTQCPNKNQWFAKHPRSFVAEFACHRCFAVSSFPKKK